VTLTAAIAEAATTSTAKTLVSRFLRVTKAFIAPLEAPFGFVWTTGVLEGEARDDDPRSGARNGEHPVSNL
jgi:hypothetical protein